MAISPKPTRFELADNLQKLSNIKKIVKNIVVNPLRRGESCIWAAQALKIPPKEIEPIYDLIKPQFFCQNFNPFMQGKYFFEFLVLSGWEYHRRKVLTIFS